MLHWRVAIILDTVLLIRWALAALIEKYTIISGVSAIVVKGKNSLYKDVLALCRIYKVNSRNIFLMRKVLLDGRGWGLTKKWKVDDLKI
jgi:hypothetical protein